MRLFCRVAVATAEIESTEVLVETFRERRSGIVLIEYMNGFKNSGDGDETEPERGDVETGLSGGEAWVNGVVVVNVDFSSEVDAVQGAVDIFL